ncbi:MAG: MCE family protein [Nitrospirae bacterium]|nr:MCE family protein [Nitrospirota bacterium]
MRRVSTELKVGVFALVVLSVLSYMTFKVSGKDWLRKEGYTVYVYFSNISGLDEKTKIKVAGVDAGVIDKVTLEGNRVRLTLRIYPEIRLYGDAVASIKTSGLLGDKYLDIRPGRGEAELKEGDMIRNVHEPMDIDDMIYRLASVSDSFQTLTKNINDVLGTEETKQALKETANNLARLTENLNNAITVNDKRLRETLEGINTLTASINRLVEDNRNEISATVSNLKEVTAEAPAMVRELEAASQELKDLLKENRPKIAKLMEKTDRTMSSVQKVAEKIEKGEGTIGKLVTDERLYESVNKAAKGIENTISRIERFRTIISFQGEYLMRTGDGKGYFDLTLMPRPDKYYILGVVDDPLGSVTTTKTFTSINGVTTFEEEEVIERKIEFTAQFARRFKDSALRIGLKENTIGLGFDQFLMNDRMKLSADIWDFDNEEEGAGNPHLKLGMDYYLFKNLFVSAGADNLLNSRWRGVYLGGGIRFEDEDFKYLFGSLPSLSVR